MKQITLVRVAMQSILKNKLRAFLTMLGIVIGVGAVIIMVGVGYGAQNSIEKQISGLGTNMVMISPGESRQGGVSMGSGSFNKLTVEDFEKLKRESTLLSGVSPVVSSFAQAIGGLGNWRTSTNGVSTDYQAIRDLQFAYGGWFTEADVRASRKVAILGATVAKNLYPETDPVGEQIQLRNVPFTIIGVLQPKGQSMGMDFDDVVIMPYTTARSRLSGWQRLNFIVGSAFSPGDIPAAQEEVRQIMRESHRLSEGEEDDFTIRNQDELAQTAQSATRIMTMLLAAIASISLLVGGIGIMNIMLVSVTERTREIGIRMAIGARGSDVLTQFLIESVVMSVMGGLIGLLLGVLGGMLIGWITGWNTATPPQAIVLAVGFSAAIGIFFGWYPARQAAALNPIQALRYE